MELLRLFEIFTSRQNCDTQDLRVVTSRSRYPKKRTLHLTEDFCLIVSKMRKICRDEGRKKAFEAYSADMFNQHPWHDKCSVVLGRFVCEMSSFLCFMVLTTYNQLGLWHTTVRTETQRTQRRIFSTRPTRTRQTELLRRSLRRLLPLTLKTIWSLSG